MAKDQNRAAQSSSQTAMGAAIEKAAMAPATSEEVITETIETMLAEQKEVLKEIQATGYGAVECSASDGAVSEKYGRKSCAAIEVLVPIPSLGLKLVCAIYGNLQVKPDGTTIEFTGYVPARMMKFMADDPSAKDRLLAHIENGAMGWHGFEKATAAAESRLMGQKPAPGVGERPRLVRNVVTKTIAAPAA